MLPEKLKKYLLSETAGRRLPTGPCPTIKDFVREVLAGVRLWPIQRLVLKIICNTHPLLPSLPYTIEESQILERWKENALDPFGNRKYSQAIVRYNRQSKSPLVVLLIMGRGSSKTFMCGIILSFLTRFLISLGDPHRYFGLAKVKPISIQCLAGKYSQIISLFRGYKSNIHNCLALRDTFDEKVESLNFGGVVEAQAFTSNADTVRGADTFAYYHEETAFCNENTPESAKSFTQCYKAIQPAVKNRFKQWGMMLFATSAGLKRGKTYELYRQIQNGTIKNCVMLQLAVWEINPNFSKADFEQEYAEDPVTADAEMGSQFVDAINTYLNEKEILSCIKPHLVKRHKGVPGVQYWIRLDPSRKNDRYAIALGHKERRTDEFGERIVTVVDHVHYWESYWIHTDTGQRYNPRTARERLEGQQYHVNTQEVLAYLHQLIEDFNVMGVSTDQFESQYIIEELNDIYGTKDDDFGFIKPITEKNNWLSYRSLRKQIITGNFEIYNELAFLQEARVAMRYNKNKPMESGEWEEEEDDETASNSFGLIYTVEAPRSGPVKTDDVLDAVAFLNFDILNNPALAPADVGAVQYKTNELSTTVESVLKEGAALGALSDLPTEW